MWLWWEEFWFAEAVRLLAGLAGVGLCSPRRNDMLDRVGEAVMFDPVLAALKMVGGVVVEEGQAGSEV